jgi:glycosyltransferase involved in cell wall biosynthesis/GT2 family glycosyltransferase
MMAKKAARGRNTAAAAVRDNPTEMHSDRSGLDISDLPDRMPELVTVSPLTVSVIINTYERADLLADCLIALSRQTYRAFEVIVVTGPCSDDTDGVIARFGVRSKIVRCAVRNLSVSRNLGIEAAQGEVCAFIDDDAVAHPRWLEELSKPYANAGVGAVGGFTIDNTGSRFQCRYTICDRFGNATLLEHIDPASRLSQAGLWLYPSLLGANSSFRTSALRRIGGFDEVFAYMLDETDVCLRILDQGLAVVTAPDALVFHRFAESHVRDERRIAKTLLPASRSKAHFVFKHSMRRMKLNEVSAELERFRTDLRFSNRWHVDRALIESRHFLRLNNEVDAGLQEGISSGITAGTAGALDRPGRVAVAAEPFKTFAEPVSQTRLSIALVSQGYPPRDSAGIARWTYELAHALADRGHHVHVITQTDEPRTVEYRRGVWVHAVPPVHDSAVHFPVDLPGSVRARATAVLQEARQIERDFGLHVLSAPIWDLEGILCTAELDIPVITSLHTAYRMVLPLKDAWRQDLPYRLHHVQKMFDGEAWLFRNAKLLLANSQAICSELQLLYGTAFDTTRVTLVPHGIAPAPESDAAPSRTDATLRVLYVGRIERRKGLDILLQAIGPLFASFPALALDVVGAPVPAEADFASLIDRLRQDIAAQGGAGRVTFHGHVDEASLRRHYAASDIFVAPSRFESFGLIAIEAMRFGKPVIAAKAGGLGEIIEPGSTGYLFRIDDADALRSALRGLISDAPRRARMGAQAARVFAERYTSSVMARKVEHCIQELLAGRPATAARAAETAELPIAAAA